MKKFLLTFVCAIATLSLMAQEEAAEAPKPWKCTGVLGLNASATGLVNWAAGGKNNVTGVAFANVRLLYNENNLSWESNLDVQYGLSWVDQKFDKLQKSSDHLKFNTKFGWEFQKTWFLTASAAFQTQMDLGRVYPGDGTVGAINSMILAPSYTDISVGIDWKKSVNGADFSIYLSPVAGRIVTAYVSDANNKKYTQQMIDGGVYAPGDDFRTTLQEANGTWKYDELNVKQYKNANAELGLNFKAGVNYTYQDLKLSTAVTLFTPYRWDKIEMYAYDNGAGVANYTKAEMETNKYDLSNAEYLGYRDNNRRFGNFDVDWTVMVSYQFLKCLNVTLSTNLKYVNGLKIEKELADGTISKAERVQFMGVLGLGVGYSF